MCLLMAFHSSLHVDSVTIPSNITGGQDILSSLSYVKRLVKKKVILLIGKLSFVSIFPESSLGYCKSNL